VRGALEEREAKEVQEAMDAVSLGPDPDDEEEVLQAAASVAAAEK
jgi:hypothetical protein